MLRVLYCFQHKNETVKSSGHCNDVDPKRGIAISGNRPQDCAEFARPQTEACQACSL